MVKSIQKLKKGGKNGTKGGEKEPLIKYNRLASLLDVKNEASALLTSDGSSKVEQSKAQLSEASQLEDEKILKLSFDDPSYFARLVDKYQEPFLRAAISITRSREEAEDILQEVFTKIYLNGRRYKREPGATFKSWAYRILINTSFTHYQKLKKSTGNVSYLDPVLYEDSVVAEGNDLALNSDNKALIAEVIVKMPEHLGRLLRLYYLEDKSYKDIAKAESISGTTLKMRLFRAKKIFKKLLDEKNGRINDGDIKNEKV